MHFTGIDHDGVTGLGFDLSDRAPGAMRAGKHDANAILVVRVAGEDAIGDQRPGFNALQSRSMLCHLVNAPGAHPIDPFRFERFSSRLGLSIAIHRRPIATTAPSCDHPANPSGGSQMRIVALEEHFTVPRIVAGISPDVIARRGFPGPDFVWAQTTKRSELAD